MHVDLVLGRLVVAEWSWATLFELRRVNRSAVIEVALHEPIELFSAGL
jgi:hypothetical protein